ncbi:ATP-binding protein [Patulibacter sp. NPDC049589]|uniref:sensor histidine kinase n=1 Tax=Patulibacter sp. NPDC049589 TaxID=3154731 RepID=UPI00343F56B8
MRPAAFFARLPIRLRVAATFALVMATLLALAGAGLYVALGATLRSGIDDALRTRAADVAAIASEVTDGRSDTSPLTERGESVAQILTPAGRIVDASPTMRSTPLLTRSQLGAAARGDTYARRPAIRPVDDDDVTRLLARPVTSDGQRLIVVVGASLEPVETAQHRLAKLLLVGGPVLLLLASVAGYGAATGALRPMERMRRDAATIRTVRSGLRLEVPPAGDEVARLAATLNDMLARLDEASRRERAFVDDASHEMRTPLALVKGELELAMRTGATVDELRAAIASAAEENDRLVRLAEDLLVLARTDDGPVLATTPIHVAELVDLVRETVVAAGRPGTPAEADEPPRVEVRLADGAEDVVVHGDERRLVRVVGNLVRNAADAGATRVTVDARVADGTAELHVLDDGSGFAEPFLPRAFERFARADDARARGGTGLGLAIVRSVAEAHGGTAGAANRPAGGADVWIRLPDRPLSSGTHPPRS